VLVVLSCVVCADDEKHVHTVDTLGGPPGASGIDDNPMPSARNNRSWAAWNAAAVSWPKQSFGEEISMPNGITTSSQSNDLPRPIAVSDAPNGRDPERRGFRWSPIERSAFLAALAHRLRGERDVGDGLAPSLGSGSPARSLAAADHHPRAEPYAAQRRAGDRVIQSPRRRGAERSAGSLADLPPVAS
jgi:hypothetical protein